MIYSVDLDMKVKSEREVRSRGKVKRTRKIQKHEIRDEQAGHSQEYSRDGNMLYIQEQRQGWCGGYNMYYKERAYEIRKCLWYTVTRQETTHVNWIYSIQVSSLPILALPFQLSNGGLELAWFAYSIP